VPRHRSRALAACLAASFVLATAAPAGAAGSDGAGIGAAGTGAAAAVDASPGPARPLPAGLAARRLDHPIHVAGAPGSKLLGLLARAAGPQRVVVSLSEPAAAALAGVGAAAEIAQLDRAREQQDGIIAAARRLDRRATLLGRTGRATNVVMLNIDTAALAALAADPAVVAIRPVVDYHLALSETVPYVGARAVQRRGYSGRGVRVAVLDSGIDYTHRELGGAGTPAAYEAAYGTGPGDPRNTTRDGRFPTARVVGGYDFVGEAWAGGPGSPAEAPDPDPIDAPPASADLGTDGGHGTHVADIIAGKSGVAPGALLYAVKVCSAVSDQCSGVALIEGMDFAVDPNGDGSTADHVDIVNMSLGTDYGTPFDDDLSAAVEQASRLGVLTVAASGNAGDRPYASGTPAAAPSALSVAQTQVPSAVVHPLVVDSPPDIAGQYPNTAAVDWAPLGKGFSGDVAFLGRGCPAGSVDGQEAADPYLADPAGKVALIERGSCNVSLKVDRAAKAGAIAVLIGLVAAGDPFSFAEGGGDTFVPTLVIGQDLSLDIQDNIDAPVHVTVSDAARISVVESVVGSSSRGPSADNLVKPEIAAPGASVSAVAGGGTAMEAFGGTSGATPMVAGAAAMLRQAFPRRSVAEIKSLLMNTAETTIWTNPTTSPGVLAPITRIGGGELRVDRALASPAAAWDVATSSGALSFGFVDASAALTTLSRTVRVHNYGRTSITYRVTPRFRQADDRKNGAVTLTAPRTVTVAAGRTASFVVRLRIDAGWLRAWTMDSGSAGADPAPLDLLEYDGYVELDNVATKADDREPLHLAWQVLPRLSDDVRAAPATVVAATPVPNGPFTGAVFGTTTLDNRGAGPAYVDAYSLVATSPRLPPAVRGANAPVVDLRAVGVQTFPVPGGPDGCSDRDSFIYSIAISAWGRTTHAIVPAEFDVYFDTDGDGQADHVVYNADASGWGTFDDGQSLTWSYDVATGATDAFFYTDHGTNSSNTILSVCGEQLGLDARDFDRPITVWVEAVDNLYSGRVTDSTARMTLRPGGERYLGMLDPDTVGSFDVDPAASATLTVVDLGASGTNPAELGLLLVLDASRPDDRGGAPRGNEALILPVAGAAP